jgi:hypothetical protein
MEIVLRSRAKKRECAETLSATLEIGCATAHSLDAAIKKAPAEANGFYVKSIEQLPERIFSLARIKSRVNSRDSFAWLEVPCGPPRMPTDALASSFWCAF